MDWLKEVERKYADATAIMEEQDGIVLFASAFGSQNYGLATYTSDTDVCAIVLPAYLEFISGKPLISKEREYSDGSHLIIRDLRHALNLLREKPSPNSIEWFLSDYIIYNPVFEPILRQFMDSNDNLFYLTHASFEGMFKACHGWAQQMRSRNIDDGKKLCYIMVVYHLLNEYLDPQNHDVRKYFKMSNDDMKLARAYKEGKLAVTSETIDEWFYNFNGFEAQPHHREIEFLARCTINRFQFELTKKYLELNKFEYKG